MTYKSNTSPPLEPISDETVVPRRVSSAKKLYDRTNWVWVIIILSGLVAQGLRSARMSRRRANFIGKPEHSF